MNNCVKDALTHPDFLSCSFDKKSENYCKYFEVILNL